MLGGLESDLGDLVTPADVAGVEADAVGAGVDRLQCQGVVEVDVGDDWDRRLLDDRPQGVSVALARVEQIKKFTIIRGDWLPGGDELTPTMKLKRKPIAEKYAAEIDAMYS